MKKKKYIVYFCYFCPNFGMTPLSDRNQTYFYIQQIYKKQGKK